MIGFANTSITRLRAPLIADEYGTPSAERDWAHATSTVITGCSIQPLIGAEYEVGREAVTVRWKIYAPAGTSLLAGDRVVYGGETYEVDSDGQEWPSPTGNLDHVQAVLKKVVG